MLKIQQHSEPEIEAVFKKLNIETEEQRQEFVTLANQENEQKPQGTISMLSNKTTYGKLERCTQ